MAPPMRYSKQSNESSDTETPSNNLWVGNLSMEVTDSDLMDLFTKYGALDSLTTYSSRNFAFLFFKRVEDAKAAKDALQGAVIRGGNPIKIEFARPARPCKNLWIGGINPSVSKEELEKEFRKFGKIDDVKFLRDRNTAAVEYTRLEDASEAMRNLNGKQFGGEQIRVDFLRSQPSRREQWHNTPDSRDGPILGRGTGPSDVDSGPKKSYSQASGVRRAEGQPSRVLWVGYPPSIQIDEQMLHNAMILFGEIESIKTFPSRHYAFVEFRSIDEARRAKEGLQGRLFNNPRITIMFSSSDLAPGAGFNPGPKGPRPDMFFSEQSPGPSQIDMFGHGFPGPLPPGNGPRPYMPSNHFGPELGDFAAHPSWRRQSSPGILPSPQGMRPNTRTWDSYDERNPKRSRMDDRIMLEQSYGGPAIDGGVHGRSPYSPPVGSKVRGGDYIWRGIIAKGGTPVCQARCVPIGKGLETELPEIVNCTARTGLDMLTKHYAEAIGFDIVFFLPDSEDDFASYTEFLHYLAAKDRAGVAKFDNGTTLFLVPPSDFLTKVLKVTGPERLYGVVLKLPQQQSPNARIVQQETHHSVPLSQYSDIRPDYIRATEEKVLPMDYNRVLHEESNFPAKPQFTPGESRPSHFTNEYTPSNVTSVSQTGVKLTPELISTLASFLPGNSQSSSQESVRPSIPQSVGPNNWNQDHHGASEPAGYLMGPSGSRFNPQTQQPQFQNYSSATHTPNFNSTQFQDLNADVARHDAASSRTFAPHSVPQNAHFPPPPPTNRPYQPEVPSNTQKSYEATRGFDPSGSYNPLFTQDQNSTAMHNQVYGVNFSQPQNVGPTSPEKGFVEAPNQAQQLQSGLSDSGQGLPEADVDKNQRYQSTLQFAANLLLQIQQKQQQTNSGAGQGGGYQP
ncbi:hypothetical protein ACFE04_005264 [Oxalis oulophora]